MAEPAKKSQWDEFDAPTGRPQVESVISPSDPPQENQKKTQWDEFAPVDDAMLQANSGFLGALHNFMKFAGHGTTRGFANAIGFPVDSFNMAGEFLANHPEFLAVSRSAGPLGGLLGDAAKTVSEARGGEPIYTGSGQSTRDLANKVGLPTSTPKEEGDTSTASYWGDVLGEFGGANLPFVAGAPVRAAGGAMMTNAQRIMQSKRPLSQALHDLVAPVVGPGLGAGVGGELVDPQNEDLGKLAGGIVGSVRPLIFDKLTNVGSTVQSWLHGWMGLGTGANAKVGEALAKSAQDLPTAVKEATNLPTLSSGAKIPVDIASQDAGLFALRRTVMAKDAEMAGDYRAMQNATERAIEADAQLSPANFNDPFLWLGAKQKVLETTVQQRLMQAVNQAEHDTDIAFRGTTPNQTDATNTKHAYALNLRKQVLAARDDMDAVVREKWNNVDKEIPIDMASVYDDINTMKAEHKARPGQSADRFPTKFINRFFDEDAPKFRVDTKLQDVIDLDSEVRQAIRELSAQDAPDRVKMSYLERLSKSLYKVKERLPDASTNVPLKDALNTTKTFHDTFSRGPVGQVLGHDVPGSPDVSPGETIKFFLSQGPGGVDSFDSLMKAVTARNKMDPNVGSKGWKPPSDQMEKMLENYIRQDFYDTVAPNGQFSERNAQRWLKNNAGPLNHFGELRKEFENAVKSQGTASEAREFAKQELQDIQRNRAALFMDGDPGRLFNGALKGPDKYGATKELVNMTKDDPTGRATEGLVQMAFDHLLASAKIPDPSLPALERLSGRHILDWLKENAGVVKALDEALPKATTQRLSTNAQRRLPDDLKEPGTRRSSGVADRFKRIGETAHYLEGFRVEPNVAKDQVHEVTPLTELIARYMGAGVGSSVASHGSGHSIQMASIGSKMFKQVAASLTPEQTAKVMRAAMTDPQFFELLTRQAATAQQAQESIRLMQPYFYSMGITLAQPALPQQKEGGGADPQEGGSGRGALMQPPHNPSDPMDIGKVAKAGAEAVAPNIMSLVEGQAPPSLGKMAERPGKTPSTDDPRIAGAVGEAGEMGLTALSMAGPAGAASLGARVVEGLATKAGGMAGRAATPALVGGATLAAGQSEASAAMTDRQKAALEFKREQAKINREEAAEKEKAAKADAERKQQAAAQASDLEKQRLQAVADTARQKAEDASRVALEQKEKEAQLEREHQQAQADRSLREKYPQLASALSNAGLMMAALFPLAARTKAVGPIKRMAEAWEDAAGNAEKALKSKDMFQAKIYIDQMAAFKKEADKMEKAGKGFSGADKSSAALNINAGLLPAEMGSTPEALDMIFGTPKAKEKAKDTLLDPMRIPPALATGAVFSGLGAKAPLPGRKPDFEKLRALSDANVKSLKDLRASETRSKSKAALATGGAALGAAEVIDSDDAEAAPIPKNLTARLEAVSAKGGAKREQLDNKLSRYKNEAGAFTTKNKLRPIDEAQLIKNMQTRIRQIEYDRRLSGRGAYGVGEGERYPPDGELNRLRTDLRDIIKALEE